MQKQTIQPSLAYQLGQLLLVTALFLVPLVAGALTVWQAEVTLGIPKGLALAIGALVSGSIATWAGRRFLPPGLGRMALVGFAILPFVFIFALFTWITYRSLVSGAEMLSITLMLAYVAFAASVQHAHYRRCYIWLYTNDHWIIVTLIGGALLQVFATMITIAVFQQPLLGSMAHLIMLLVCVVTGMVTLMAHAYRYREVYEKDLIIVMRIAIAEELDMSFNKVQLPEKTATNPLWVNAHEISQSPAVLVLGVINTCQYIMTWSGYLPGNRAWVLDTVLDIVPRMTDEQRQRLYSNSDCLGRDTRNLDLYGIHHATQAHMHAFVLNLMNGDYETALAQLKTDVQRHLEQPTK